MKRVRGFASYLVLGLVIALFAASSLVSFSRIEQQKRELLVERNSILWLATALEIEFLQLITAFTRHTLAPDPAALDNVRHRLDITWSRLPVLLEGSEAAPLRRLQNFGEVMQRTREALERADECFATATSDRTALDSLIRDMQSVRPMLQEFLTAAMLTDELSIDRMHDRARALQTGLYASFLGMLVSGAALVLILVREARLASRARGRAELQSRVLQEEMTERVRAHAALHHSETRFKDFAEAAADWFWEMDDELHFSYLSDRFEEVMGLDPAEVLGVDLEPLRQGQGDGRERWEAHARALAERKVIEDFDVRWVRRDGQTRHLSLSARPVFDDEGSFQGYRGVTRDVTQERELTEQMAHLASHDPLTGLVNRREFEHRLERVLETSRADGSTHALCFLDLDQFKVVNDTCGHIAGDELLREVSGRFSACVRRRDTLSRLGGDEFGVLIEHCTPVQAHRVAEELRRAVESMRFTDKGRTFTLSTSIGLVSVNADSESLTEVLSAADSACYVAKDAGRNQVHVYRPDDVEFARRRGEMQWLSGIQAALDTDRFELHAQNIATADADAEAPGDYFEVLVRMIDDSGERILPGVFLPAAERYHVSPRLDRWVIRHAIQWLAQWRHQLTDDTCCFVNLSGLSLGDPQMLEYIVSELESTGVDAKWLCFEVTETAAISNIGNAVRFFEHLRARGCRFALDDFGSGVSSFGYLRTLPVDFLKIDGTFVRDIMDDPVDLAMVRSINEIGQRMGKQTIAEWVENDRTLATLRALGLDYVQGLYLGPPTPLAERRPRNRSGGNSVTTVGAP